MKKYLKNSVIYQVFVRNFTKEGDFKSLTDEQIEEVKEICEKRKINDFLDLLGKEID